ncbi:hypothetical protein BJV78DRAFT_1157383 [Lactifluus subvellereus]|nr:hypothetical protein BJV78DRAFT_1157383 [Lactifluus subvellereus]
MSTGYSNKGLPRLSRSFVRTIASASVSTFTAPIVPTYPLQGAGLDLMSVNLPSHGITVSCRFVLKGINVREDPGGSKQDCYCFTLTEHHSAYPLVKAYQWLDKRQIDHCLPVVSSDRTQRRIESPAFDVIIIIQTQTIEIKTPSTLAAASDSESTWQIYFYRYHNADYLDKDTSSTTRPQAALHNASDLEFRRVALRVPEMTKANVIRRTWLNKLKRIYLSLFNRMFSWSLRWDSEVFSPQDEIVQSLGPPLTFLHVFIPSSPRALLRATLGAEQRATNLFLIIRTENWDERLGCIAIDALAVILARLSD